MTTLTPPITLTDEARRAVWSIRDEKGIPAQYALRIGMKGAGCGAQYLLGFDQATTTDDQFEIAGIQVLIDRRHLLYVVGLEIDFESGEAGAGFTFLKETASVGRAE